MKSWADVSSDEESDYETEKIPVSEPPRHPPALDGAIAEGDEEEDQEDGPEDGERHGGDGRSPRNGDRRNNNNHNNNHNHKHNNNRRRRPQREIEIPEEPPFTLFIGNMPFSLTDGNELGVRIVDLVKERFNEDIRVKRSRIAIDRRENKPRGFGYIEVETADMVSGIAGSAHFFLSGRKDKGPKDSQSSDRFRYKHRYQSVLLLCDLDNRTLKNSPALLTLCSVTLSLPWPIAIVLIIYLFRLLRSFLLVCCCQLRTVLKLGDGESMLEGRSINVDVAEAYAAGFDRQNRGGPGGGGGGGRNNSFGGSFRSQGSFTEVDGSAFQGGRYSKQRSQSFRRQNSAASDTGGPATRPTLKLKPRSSNRDSADQSSAGSSIFGSGKARDEQGWASRRSSSAVADDKPSGADDATAKDNDSTNKTTVAPSDNATSDKPASDDAGKTKGIKDGGDNTPATSAPAPPAAAPSTDTQASPPRNDANAKTASPVNKQTGGRFSRVNDGGRRDSNNNHNTNLGGSFRRGNDGNRRSNYNNRTKDDGPGGNNDRNNNKNVDDGNNNNNNNKGRNNDSFSDRRPGRGSMNRNQSGGRVRGGRNSFRRQGSSTATGGRSGRGGGNQSNNNNNNQSGRPQQKKDDAVKNQDGAPKANRSPPNAQAVPTQKVCIGVWGLVLMVWMLVFVCRQSDTALSCFLIRSSTWSLIHSHIHTLVLFIHNFTHDAGSRYQKGGEQVCRSGFW